MKKNTILKDYLKKLQEDESKVKIPVKKGELGLSLDDPQESYKNKLKSGKPWEANHVRESISLIIYGRNGTPRLATEASTNRENNSGPTVAEAEKPAFNEPSFERP